MNVASRGKISIWLAAAFFAAAGATFLFANLYRTSDSTALSAQPVKVVATYYGGNYDEKLGWVIDNNEQCNRIQNHKTSEYELKAILSKKLKSSSGVYTCSRAADDPGVGYFDDIPLHNSVSFAELSNGPDYDDYSALGNLPARTKVEINYSGRCIIAEKLDVGTGGEGMPGYPRAIDLWWQTARSLGFKSGFDLVSVRVVDKSAPLTAIGTSYVCGSTPPAAGSNPAQPSGSSGAAAATSAKKTSSKKTARQKKKTTKTVAARNNKSKNQVLGAEDINTPAVIQSQSGIMANLWRATAAGTVAAIIALLLAFHSRRLRHLDLVAEAKKIIRT